MAKKEKIKKFIDYIQLRGISGWRGIMRLCDDQGHNDRYSHYKIYLGCHSVKLYEEAERAVIIERLSNKLTEIAWRDFQIKIIIKDTSCNETAMGYGEFDAKISIDKLVYWWEKKEGTYITKKYSSTSKKTKGNYILPIRYQIN